MSDNPAVPPDLSATVPEDLRRRLRTLRQRYGKHRSASAGYRFEVATNRRRFQLAEIRNQIAELEQRAKIIEDELNGFGKGMAALAIEEIAEYEKEFPEAWSPSPVLGYRVWTIERNRLVGARFVWETPVFEATCKGNPSSDDVPHTDERCGRLGCGVYATKHLDDLLGEHVLESTRNYLAGLVALDGKVVEHEHGYRGARAEVVSAALIGRSREVFSSDPDVIAAIFADPAGALSSGASAALAAPLLSRITRHLSKRKDEPWI